MSSIHQTKNSIDVLTHASKAQRLMDPPLLGLVSSVGLVKRPEGLRTVQQLQCMSLK